MELTSQNAVERATGREDELRRETKVGVGCHAKYDAHQIRLRGPEDHAAGCCDWQAPADVRGAIGAFHRKEGAEIEPGLHNLSRTIWEVGTWPLQYQVYI
jgi:hypothetical protein